MTQESCIVIFHRSALCDFVIIVLFHLFGVDPVCLPFSCSCFQIALQDDRGNQDVRVFVRVDGNEILIGTLSVGKHTQCTIGLVFEKEFELLHTSKNSSISALGYKFIGHERKYPFILHSSMLGKKLSNNILFLNCLLCLIHILF